MEAQYARIIGPWFYHLTDNLQWILTDSFLHKNAKRLKMGNND